MRIQLDRAYKVLSSTAWKILFTNILISIVYLLVYYIILIIYLLVIIFTNIYYILFTNITIFIIKNKIMCVDIYVPSIFLCIFHLISEILT